MMLEERSENKQLHYRQLNSIRLSATSKCYKKIPRKAVRYLTIFSVKAIANINICACVSIIMIETGRRIKFRANHILMLFIDK